MAIHGDEGLSLPGSARRSSRARATRALGLVAWVMVLVVQGCGGSSKTEPTKPTGTVEPRPTAAPEPTPAPVPDSPPPT